MSGDGLQTLQLPELVLGAGVLRCRVSRSFDGLCIDKSKVAQGLADAALSLYTKKLADDHPELSEFLRGQKRDAGEQEQQLAKRVQLAAIEDQKKIWLNMKLSFCGWMQQSLEGYFSTNQNGFFQTLKNVIQGAKQRKKATHNALLYPADQRATDRDMVFQLTLLSVALELMPELTPRVYDHVKNAYGKRALMWTNVPNGGQQYVYLNSERDILIRAWTDTHFGRTASGLPLGEWTSDTCTLLLPDLSSTDE